MKEFGRTLLLVFGLFLLFIGLKSALKIMSPYIRPISQSLADFLASV